MIQAICHDNRTLISGVIRNVTEAGCELLCTVDTGTPAFPKKAQITLNLSDEVTGRTMNVTVRLIGVSRRDGAWSYRIKWKQLPEILSGVSGYEGTSQRRAMSA